jgi:hypothetical protein
LQEWHTHRDSLPPAFRQSCEETLAESERLLGELMEHERISTEFLARRRDETRSQLQQISAGSHAQAAYRDSLAPVTHRVLDVDQ